MARLIDAEKLQLEPDPWGGMNGVLIVESGRRSGKTMALVQKAMRQMIENAPTVDAVEVVRCKDCKHFDGKWFCKKCGVPSRKPNDFCSYGERRTDV